MSIFSILLQAGVDMNAKDNDGWTALHAAAHWGQEEACKILAENMCDMESKNLAVLYQIIALDKTIAVIFLPVRPASQTHDSHKGRMILNHVNPAGRIKNCGEKSAFKNLQLSF